MTRVLSELLGDLRPEFRLNLQQVENSAGRPNADIRLTTEVQRDMRAKLSELGLDGTDTTGRELYTALGARLQGDEQRFAAAVRQAASKKSDDMVGHVAFVLKHEVGSQTCLALKSSIAKRILKANLPKKTMKLLGYRSVDSLFKHETAASLYAAAWLVESEQWAKRIIAGYAKLKSSDFELRKIDIDHPTSKRWQAFSETVVKEKRHNVLAFKELGTVVLLPLPEDGPQLPTLTTAVLALHGVNEILAASSYLKLHQVQSGFGATVRQVVLGAPLLEARLLDRPVSWNLVQQYYARFADFVKTDIFEPLVQAEDLAWHSIEQVLSRIEPSLAFWQGTYHLGHMYDGTASSCNLTDNILSHSNDLPYESRIVDYFRSGLMTELLLRYMSHERVEQAITGQVQRQLASEPAAA